jgi:hypothetical protein
LLPTTPGQLHDWRCGHLGRLEDPEEDPQGWNGGVDHFPANRTVGESDPTGVLEHCDIGVAQHGYAERGILGKSECTRDLVAMRRTRIEGFDHTDRDARSLEVVENIGAFRTDRVYDEVARCHAGELGQGGEPAQRIEVKARILVDDATKSPF